MDFWSIIATLLFLYWSYCILRWIYETATSLLVRLWRRVDPRPQAHIRRRFQRIARKTKDRNTAIKNVAIEEARAIDDILRR